MVLVTVGSAIEKLFPMNINWNMRGDTYDDIIWLDKTIPKPSEDVINEAMEELKIEYAYEILRKERNEKLAACDYLFVNDYPHESEEIKNLWITHRQKLRDITTSQIPVYNVDEIFRRSFITGIDWPVQPSP
jgi:hypothetical protein